MAQLHATLETLKRESEQKIIKLKAENEEATRYAESCGTVPSQPVCRSFQRRKIVKLPEALAGVIK